MHNCRGGGTALYSGHQSSFIKNNNLICSSSISAMGTGLVETIAAKSKKFKKLICIIGMEVSMNIQDLQTIKQDKIM